jgi:DUF4097 and DUF4098 domain-containing protein YvlB
MRIVYRWVTMAALALSSVAAYASADFEKTVPAQARGTVEISNVAGEIQVSGWDRPEVSVRGDLGAGVERVEVTSEGNRTLIKVVLPSMAFHNGSADLKVQIPRDSELDISAVSAEVRVANVQGVQRLNTVSGDITSELVAPEGEFKTVSGGVRLRGHGVTARLHVSTVSGDVHIEHAAGDLEVGTVSGTLRLQLDTASSVRAHSTSGDVSFEGQLGHGANFEATTVSGDLSVRARSDGFRYEVSSFTGDINSCFDVSAERTSKYAPGKTLQGSRGDGAGYLRLKTMSGDIEVCDRK